jgi:hypothetical protein
MLLWFSMLGLFGIIWIQNDWSILRAISPVYAWELLTTHQAGSAGFWALGAVFLCTTPFLTALSIVLYKFFKINKLSVFIFCLSSSVISTKFSFLIVLYFSILNFV